VLSPTLSCCLSLIVWISVSGSTAGVGEGDVPVYVIGASPAGLSPQAWNALKTFWTLYFREAGAELVSYSAECGIERD
jgi:hypothetical protein